MAKKKLRKFVSNDAIVEMHNDAAERKRRANEHISQVTCPDCGAWLNITSQHPLPDDIKIEFVKHRI